MIVCSHFDRPKGKRVPAMSLRPMAAALAEVLGRPVRVRRRLRRPAGEEAVAQLRDGDVLVLENTRYHAGEERTTRRWPANWRRWPTSTSTTPSPPRIAAMPAPRRWRVCCRAYAGRLMQAELEALQAALGTPQRPVAAIVGGSKVSTKLDLLGNLVGKVDMLVIGGAMANTFLAAQGHDVGKSLQESDMHETALRHPARPQGGRLRDRAAGRRGGARRIRRQSADRDRAGRAVPAEP